MVDEAGEEGGWKDGVPKVGGGEAVGAGLVKKVNAIINIRGTWSE